MDPVESLTRTVTTTSTDETFSLGERLGRVLEPHDFVGLDGQLGAGKTLFSRGVASGAGVPLEDVSSPTYSIVQTYSGRLTLHHADLYRLATEADTRMQYIQHRRQGLGKPEAPRFLLQTLRQFLRLFLAMDIYHHFVQLAIDAG